ncbi:MAG: hypothetical protein OEP95_05465 [Myxococcales bacterium]|nr:hypothetical protein [Myxococcales bacterium]
MSLTSRGARRLLWLALIFTAPIPFYLGGLEIAPLARGLFFSLLIWGIVATEGAGGFQGAFALLAAVQMAVGAGLLWCVAALAARGMRGATPATRAFAVGAIVVALIGFSLQDVYRTPLSSTRPQSSLLGLFE